MEIAGVHLVSSMISLDVDMLQPHSLFIQFGLLYPLHPHPVVVQPQTYFPTHFIARSIPVGPSEEASKIQISPLKSVTMFPLSPSDFHPSLNHHPSSYGYVHGAQAERRPFCATAASCLLSSSSQPSCLSSLPPSPLLPLSCSLSWVDTVAFTIEC